MDAFRFVNCYVGIIQHMASEWTFLSNYGHVLVALARDPEARMRDVAEQVGITERAVQQIVADLVEEGYVEKVKLGRRNQYRLADHRNFRHRLESEVRIEDFLTLMTGSVTSGRW